MKKQFSRFLFGFMLTMLLSSSFAENMAILERYPSGSIQTVERANQAIDDVQHERDLLQESFLDKKDDCLQRFFVSSCLNKAKEAKRQAKKQLRTVEVEANAFLRKEKAVERDRGVAERQQQAEQAQGKKIIRLPDASEDNQPSSQEK
jgi:hypothetical protein